MNALHIYFSNHSSGSADIGMALMTLFLPIELWNDRRIRKSNDNGESQDDDNLNRTIDSFDSFDEDLESAQTSYYCLFVLMRDRTLELTDQTKQKHWCHKKHMLEQVSTKTMLLRSMTAFYFFHTQDLYQSSFILDVYIMKLYKSHQQCSSRTGHSTTHFGVHQSLPQQ